MRVAASYFGLVGGMVGLFWGAGILTLCPGSCPLDIQGSARMDALLWGSFAAFFLSIAGVSGWIIAYVRPDVGGWLMLLAGAGSLIAAFPLFLVPGLLLAIGGGFSLVPDGTERGQQVRMAEVKVADDSRHHPQTRY